MEDYTDPQQQEDALRIALASAEHANKAKTAFLNNMSHDIRTLMNAIMDIQMPKMDGYMATTEIRSCFIYQLSHRMTTCFFAANSGITCRTIEAASFSFDSFFCHIR